MEFRRLLLQLAPLDAQHVPLKPLLLLENSIAILSVLDTCTLPPPRLLQFVLPDKGLQEELSPTAQLVMLLSSVLPARQLLTAFPALQDMYLLQEPPELPVPVPLTLVLNTEPVRLQMLTLIHRVNLVMML